MQLTASGANTLQNAASQTPSLQALLTLRLIGGLVGLLGALIAFVGTSWDIQWHTLIGRDRTLIPPHEMMLTGIAIGGIAALTVVITETVWTRRAQGAQAASATSFAGLFSAPLGAYILGFAALDSAVGFPLDTYWHTLYGIDVSLWAPFHIMIIAGMAYMALGSVYLLTAAAPIAERLHARWANRTAHLGMICAFAATLSLFTLLVAEGINVDRAVPLAFTSFSLFPLLAALLLGAVLGGAAFTSAGKWVATSVVGVSFLLLLIDQLAIPPALRWLMEAEQLHFRPGRAQGASVALVIIAWPLLYLVGAVLIDLCVQRARTKHWTGRQLVIGLTLAALVGALPASLETPLVAFDWLGSVGVLGAALTLAFGALGGVIGAQLGHTIGLTTRTLDTQER